MQSEPGSPTAGNFRDGSPDRQDDTADPDRSEKANCRETIRAVRSFMGWHQIPDFDSASSSLDVSQIKPTRKVPGKCQ